MPESDPFFRVKHLTKSFGKLRAVDDVTFDIPQGTFVGLIGPNGAGKTTLFDLVTGVQVPDRGQVFFRGNEITGNSLQKNAALGLVRTFQKTRTLGRMTVRENLLVASQLADQPMERAEELLRMFELKSLENTLAQDLSFGQQKFISLSQALMLDPHMILLDEPFGGVNPSMEDRILGMIHTFLDQGVTFLLVEHDMDIVMSECEDIIVMNSGQLLTRGTAEEIQKDKRTLEAYFGSES